MVFFDWARVGCWTLLWRVGVTVLSPTLQAVLPLAAVIHTYAHTHAPLHMTTYTREHADFFVVLVFAKALGGKPVKPEPIPVPKKSIYDIIMFFLPNSYFTVLGQRVMIHLGAGHLLDAWVDGM